MNKKRKIRVAIISALSIVAVVLGIIAFWPQQQQQNIDMEPLRTPEVVTLELLVTPSPTPLHMPTETPVLAEDNNTVEPTIKQTTCKESNALFIRWIPNFVADARFRALYKTRKLHLRFLSHLQGYRWIVY